MLLLQDLWQGPGLRPPGVTQAQRDMLCTHRVLGKLRATRPADGTVSGHMHPLCAQHPKPHVSVSMSHGKEDFVSSSGWPVCSWS